MTRKPHKRTPKTPTVAQRLKAQAQERARAGEADGALGNRDVRVDKAQLAWSRRQYDEAIRHYEAALARRPRDPILLVDVARAYRGCGLGEVVVTTFARLIAGRGEIPAYYCAPTNVRSHRNALGSGFLPVASAARATAGKPKAEPS
jgi:hypothetical protein